MPLRPAHPARPALSQWRRARLCRLHCRNVAPPPGTAAMPPGTAVVPALCCTAVSHCRNTAPPCRRPTAALPLRTARLPRPCRPAATIHRAPLLDAFATNSGVLRASLEYNLQSLEARDGVFRLPAFKAVVSRQETSLLLRYQAEENWRPCLARIWRVAERAPLVSGALPASGSLLPRPPASITLIKDTFRGVKIFSNQDGVGSWLTVALSR